MSHIEEETQTEVTHIEEEKVVYMVLYNYQDKDYSVITIMSSVNKAYEYICNQETCVNDKFNLIEVNHVNELPNRYTDANELNICYIKSSKYCKFELCDNSYISSYVIVPMKIN